MEIHGLQREIFHRFLFSVFFYSFRLYSTERVILYTQNKIQYFTFTDICYQNKE